jgi:hypothetical protein
VPLRAAGARPVHLHKAASRRSGRKLAGRKAGKQALGLSARDPIPLFGLGGMTQARKPKVALDTTADGPLLRLYFTGGSAVLPWSL